MMAVLMEIQNLLTHIDQIQRPIEKIEFDRIYKSYSDLIKRISPSLFDENEMNERIEKCRVNNLLDKGLELIHVALESELKIGNKSKVKKTEYSRWIWLITFIVILGLLLISNNYWNISDTNPIIYNGSCLMILALVALKLTGVIKSFLK